MAGQQKSLLVAGDRHWPNGSISEPQPFDRVPLDWRHAFGGLGFAPNPVGRGLVPEDDNGVPVLRLPNVEYAGEQVQDLAARPRPAGFGALDVTVPLRALKAGTYDARWLKEDFPGFALDIAVRVGGRMVILARTGKVVTALSKLPHEGIATATLDEMVLIEQATAATVMEALGVTAAALNAILAAPESDPASSGSGSSTSDGASAAEPLPAPELGALLGKMASRSARCPSGASVACGSSRPSGARPTRRSGPRRGALRVGMQLEVPISWSSNVWREAPPPRP